MKKISKVFVTGLLVTSALTIVGCGGEPGPKPVTFTFTADIVDEDNNPLTTIYKGTQYKINITPSIDPLEDTEKRNYTYRLKETIHEGPEASDLFREPAAGCTERACAESRRGRFAPSGI